MIHVSNLTKKYGKVLANNDLSFLVENGEIAVLLGPNGAGKSTAIKAIAGLIRFEGHIAIDDLDNKTLDAKRLLGYVPEMPALYELLTVEEHLEFMARAYRLPDDYKQEMEKLLTRFELDDKRKKLGSQLSKGMQQKVSLCCALLIKPKAILFDEPLVGLDPHAIKELKLIIKELKEAGCSVLISTHMLDSVEELWDKTLIMMNGRIEACRTRAEFQAGGETLEELFFRITSK